MMQEIYNIYVKKRNIIKKNEESYTVDELKTNNIYQYLCDSVSITENFYPEFKARYERHQKMQNSFTPEQIHYICSVIGDWYLEWKNKMWVDGKPNEHFLGMAKEQLKTMICGE